VNNQLTEVAVRLRTLEARAEVQRITTTAGMVALAGSVAGVVDG
jgi:hypothetical protein